MITLDNIDGQISAQLMNKTIKAVWKQGRSLIFETTDGHYIHIGVNEGGYYHEKTDVAITLPGVQCGGGSGQFM